MRTTRLDWSCCRNVRDVGGLPVSRDGRVQPGRLVRSDALDRLDDTGHAAFRGFGVGRVIDLRTDAEVAARPDPCAGDPVYVRVPWVATENDRTRELGELYQADLDRNTGQVASVVRAFRDAPPGAVVVHCLGGKDRTGMCVALLLTVAGVSREDVVADYSATEGQIGVPVDTPDRYARSAP